MRSRLLLVTAVATVIVASVFAITWLTAPRPSPQGMGEPGPYPSDWFGTSRAWPDLSIPQKRFREAVAQARADRAAARLALARKRSDAAAGPRGSLDDFAAAGLTALEWTQAGPYNIGGRVTALAVHPGDGTIASGEIVYLAAANGGVWKSTNFGVNWSPITDDLSVFSMGALAIDEDRPDTVYVGTGEANSSVDSYDGNGLYRTQDGGATWEHLGLDETARIARVRIDPSNPSRIYVAAMGQQFSTDSNRGLYRSEDGGTSWQKMLFVSDSTGCADIVVNPAHPETVYAAMWERVRRPTYRRAYGPSCRIWRSVDSGDTWQVLSNGLPTPSDNVGRIGLAIAGSQPSTVYAQYITGASGGYVGLGMYRTDDGGDTWVRKDVSNFTNSFGGFGWYFGDMAVHPLIPDNVIAMGVSLKRSVDGGVTFSAITGSAHVDQHAIWIDPSNPSRIYLGNDGGFYWSTNGAATWNKSTDLPITQFYAGEIDPSNPARLLGGTQDNNTLLTAGSPSAWTPILGGDGFYCVVDPTDPNVIIAEYQFCSGGTGPWRSTTGGGGWSIPAGIQGSGDSFNWNTPIVMSPHDHDVVLTGSHRIWRSTDNGVSYTPASGDLTTNPPALLSYGTISTIDVSPVSPLIYYVGTDDAQVWRTLNAGATWENISAGLPVRYVTRVTADPVDSMVVYVTHSGFGLDETQPHVHRSTDMGTSWNDITSNLPNAPANDILVDPADTQTLYLGTDVGVYASRNLGAGWFPLGSGMPLQTIFDLTLHSPSRTLVAATHGRSQWKLDLNALPVSVDRTLGIQRLALSVPHPNPTRGITNLSLELATASRIGIDIYDAQGRRVRALADREFVAGRHSISWDGRDDAGAALRAGLYFIRAEGAGAAATRRVVRVD